MKVQQKSGVGDCHFVETWHLRILMGFEGMLIL